MRIFSEITWILVLPVRQRDNTTPKKGFPGYNTKAASDGEAPILDIWGVWSALSLGSLPGPP